MQVTWNMMNCINRRSITGFPNQNKSSRGFTWVPTVGPVCSTISSAKEDTTCWSFVPTTMTSFDIEFFEMIHQQNIEQAKLLQRDLL